MDVWTLFQKVKQRVLARPLPRLLERSPSPQENALQKAAQTTFERAGRTIAEFAETVEGRVWEWEHRLLFWSETPSKGQEIAEQLARMMVWLGVPRPMTVVLWWRDDPRRLEANQWPTSEQVNGGWTLANSSTIFIYRAEEWDRVVFHELIHALGWDWKMPSTPLPCWGFPTGSSLYPHLFEAWTELLAEWMWVAWHSSDYADWEKQRKWQDWQAGQVLARISPKQVWKEDTNIFAYYVLKAALAPYLPRLLIEGPGKPAERNAFLCSLNWRSLRTGTPQRLSMRMTIDIKQ